MNTTALSRNMQATREVSRLATVSMAAIAYFAAVLVALHVLRPDLDPISRPTSAYAVGPYSLLMTSAFLSMSVATWALIVGLYQGVPPWARSRVGLVLLGIWGVAALVAMTFPIDLEGAPQTLSGTIHRINGPLGFLSLTIGIILVSWRLKHDESWRPFHRTALILSLVILTAFIAGGVSIAAESGFAGLAQRVDLAAVVTWYLLTAARLRSTVRE
jgi:hypothetical protein